MKLKDALRLVKQQAKKENNRRYYQKYYQRNKTRAVKENCGAPERQIKFRTI
jgi:hypothetical protein